MTPELKERWIAALESGEYVKGKTYLQNEDEGVTRWCCLGVLCDILDPEGWEAHYPGALPSRVHRSNGSSFLSSEIRTRVFGEQEAWLAPAEEALVRINDTADTFEPAIAYIRENL